MTGHGIRLERETIIVFNDAEDTASIWTASETVYRHLRKRGYLPSEDNERSAKFEMSKSEIKLPRPKRRMTEERRKAVGERLKSARFSQDRPVV